MTDLSADVERALVEALNDGDEIVNCDMSLDDPCSLLTQVYDGVRMLTYAGKILAQALKERDEARAALSSDDRVVFIDEDGDTVEVRANNEESYRWRFALPNEWSEWLQENINTIPPEHKPVTDRIRKLCESLRQPPNQAK